MPERTAVSRLELLRLRRLRNRAEHGSTLLHKKREALTAELFRLARPAGETHARVTELMQRASSALLDALALHGNQALRAASWPEREYRVQVAARRVWGMEIMEITGRPPMVRSLAARATNPVATGLALADTATAFETLIDEVLEAAPRELLLRQLAAALAKTSRQVNTLDARVVPRITRDIRRFARALEERERDERVRAQHLRKRIH